jgi:hypothetical protein
VRVTVVGEGETGIAVVESDGVLINDAQDALDLIATVRGDHHCDAMVIDRPALAPSFFDLSTGVAGEILLKFTNYHFRVAFVGDFETGASESLGDFIRESNRGSQFFFTPTVEDAIGRLRGA